MKLGFLTDYNQEIVNFAGIDPSFNCLEISGPPMEWIGDSDQAQDARLSALNLLSKNGLTISSFLIQWPSIRTRKSNLMDELDRMKQIMDVCKIMDNAIMAGAGPLGYDPEISLEDNVGRYKEVYSPIADLAEKRGIKVAFENWPGDRGVGPFGDGASLAVTPETWGLMFEAVPSPVMGLELDPSHLIWQKIDPHLALDEFAERVHIIHAKDTEIFDGRIKRDGIFRRSSRGWGHWGRYRLPGFAHFDWQKLFIMCYERQIECPIIIEHEDQVYSGERRLEGLSQSGKFLRNCLLQA